MNRYGLLFLLAGVLVASAVALSPTFCDDGQPEATVGPDYGHEFWEHWGDGNAELAGYALNYPRYGEVRSGTAVAIFVTETFANSIRVKHERTDRDAADTFPVMKLNWIQDFSTGLYDYNLMTSAFVALAEVNGRPAGTTTKVSFSTQEWCGQAYAQLRFDGDGVGFDSHSYFDGEADQRQTLPYPPDGLSEDSLPIWARGMAAPLLGPGESREGMLLRSLERSRLSHLPPEWRKAVLKREEGLRRISVPAGEFQVEVRTVTAAAGRTTRDYPPSLTEVELPPTTWTFYVEAAPPHRLVRWTRSDEFEAELLGSTRLPYWSLSGEGNQKLLEQLGLSPRPPRTP